MSSTTLRRRTRTSPAGLPAAALETSTIASAYVYLDDVGAEAHLGFSVAGGERGKGRRMKELRRRGGGPRYIRIGKAARYRSDWLDEWAEANAVASTSEETARRRE